MISISNLSWDLKDEEDVFRYLKNKDINLIEMSLTKKFGHWEDITTSNLKEYKNYIFENFGLKISSLQSVFFDKPYSLFYDNSLFLDHFKKVIDYADVLSCNYIVFGSPKNRKRIDLDLGSCDKIFIETFQKISDYNPKILIGIEPNPRYYNCDYLYNFDQVYNIINQTRKNNIKAHLDFACISLENDDYNKIYNMYKNELFLIHVSVKDLKYIHEDDKIKKFFNEIDVEEKCFSIEMNNQSFENIIKSIEILTRRANAQHQQSF